LGDLRRLRSVHPRMISVSLMNVIGRIVLTDITERRRLKA
jgi:hypothetical protein